MNLLNHRGRVEKMGRENFRNSEKLVSGKLLEVVNIEVKLLEDHQLSFLIEI